MQLLSFIFSLLIHSLMMVFRETETCSCVIPMFIHIVFDGCGSWFHCFKILHAFLSSPMLATNPTHLMLLIFHHPYTIWWEVHIQKFLIMQFPLICCCLEVHISSSAPTTQTPSTHICNFTVPLYIFMQDMKLSHILTTILFTITK